MVRACFHPYIDYARYLSIYISNPFNLPNVDFPRSSVLDDTDDHRGNLVMIKQFRPALITFIFFSLLLGVIYPLFITGISHVMFPSQANGTVIEKNGKAIGSGLIGQEFSTSRYFWGRPSATSPNPYTAFDSATQTGSSGSNLGQLSKALVDQVRNRVDVIKSADPGNQNLIPVDLVTASGSGLDPDISIASAYYQIPRIALARGISESKLKILVDQQKENPALGFLGLSYLNVLKLNIALDDLQ
jgi:potassium-transporting ATPase KdpC subunit